MHDAIIPPSRVRLYVPDLVSCPRSDRGMPAVRFMLSWRRHVGSVTLYLALLLSTQPARAVDVGVMELYQQGQYEIAATRGLLQLLAEPWNHALRFVVADRLQRGGKYDDAASQFQALEGTPYAQSAALRLNVLRSLQRAPKSAPPAPTLVATPQKIVAPMPAAAPEATPAPQPPPLAAVQAQPVAAAATPDAKPEPAQQQRCDTDSAQDSGAPNSQGLPLAAGETLEGELPLVISGELVLAAQQVEGSPARPVQLLDQDQDLLLHSVPTLRSAPCQERP